MIVVQLLLDTFILYIVVVKAVMVQGGEYKNSKVNSSLVIKIN